MDQEFQIPGYQLLDKIGEGAHGAVYRARQLSLDRLVAVKVLSPKLASDAEYTATFFQEARAAARLSHSNIVQAIEVGSHEGVWFFVMELVEGGNLHEYLARSGPATEPETLELALHMAQALDFAWRRAGIIHRDIKPANILLTPEGQAKLADLGLAMRHGSQTETQTYIEGTPQYCAPEQCRGETNLDTRTDLYGLGATLYHMACGRPPFDDDDPAKVMAMQMTRPPEPPRRLNQNISRELEALILKLLAKDPADRYQSPAELVEVIEQMRARMVAPPPAPRVVVVRPAPAVSAVPTAPSRKRPAWVWVGGTALVLLGLGALALVAVFALRPEWIRGNVATLSEPEAQPGQATHIGARAARVEPAPSGTQRTARETPVRTAPARTVKTVPPPAQAAAATTTTPAKTADASASASPQDVQTLLDTVTAMVKTNNYVGAEAMLQKALDQWADAPKLRTRIETVWQDVQTAHIAYEKKRTEDEAATATAEKARREKLEADIQATLAPVEPWARAFYIEHALKLLCATLATTTDAELRAALQDKVTELQLLCDLKKQLVSAIKRGRLQARVLPLTSGSTIEGRPTAADAEGLGVALSGGTGMIELPWNRFTEPAIYAMLQEAFAAGNGQAMAAMALYAWETGRADDAKRYFDLAKAALADKLPAIVKRRAEQG
ncbi:MAG: serine/threonine protein kinase [Verrucomicrobia bacterium]|nr:serine/threonine protein kinase [Verrucomicrobiota bacterium]